MIFLDFRSLLVYNIREDYNAKKKCFTCQEFKDINDFHNNKSHKDGLSSICKTCQHNYVNNHYKNNKQYYLDKDKKYINENKLWFQTYKEKLFCKKCNFSGLECPAVLDFHHTNDNKEDDISQMINSGKSRESIIKEIEKCEILCANCHRKLHYKPRKCNG